MIKRGVKSLVRAPLTIVANIAFVLAAFVSEVRYSDE